MIAQRMKWKLRPIKRFLLDDVSAYVRICNKKPFICQIKECHNLYRLFRYMPYHYFKTPLCTKLFSDDVLNYIPPKIIERALPDLNFLRTHEEARRLADKAAFEQIMVQHGIPCIRTIAVIDERGRLLSPDGDLLDEAKLRTAVAPFRGKVFIKPLKGSGGAGVQTLDLGRDGMTTLLSKRAYIIQPVLSQHPDMSNLFASCINTVRIDTFLDQGSCLHNAAVVRIGTGQSLADNWDLGAIAVGINLNSGRLMQLGWKKNKFGEQGGFAEHPDSKTTFEGYQIPYWNEIKRLVCAAAKIAQPCRSLGWDVAVTPSGPLLIETNVLWDVNLMQTAWGGLADSPIARHVLGGRRTGAGTIGHL